MTTTIHCIKFLKGKFYVKFLQCVIKFCYFRTKPELFEAFPKLLEKLYDSSSFYESMTERGKPRLQQKKVKRAERRFIEAKKKSKNFMMSILTLTSMICLNILPINASTLPQKDG